MSVQVLRTPTGITLEQLYLLTETVNLILRGRANNTGTFTLDAGTGSTTVVDPAFESSMVPLLIPTTANAAGALSGLYVSARDKGSFTLTHANTGTTDRTFLYARWG